MTIGTREMLNEYYEVEALIKQAREDYKDK